jgi:tetratricopeptide (TPR) repeat protein
MELPWSKYPSFRAKMKRRWVIVAAVLGLGLLVASGAGIYLLRSGYLQERSLRTSREFFSAGDVRSALLMLQQTVQLYPENVNARRMLAEYYLEVGSSLSVGAWREVTEREPGIDTNYLSLAEAALAFGDEATVREAIGRVGSSGRQTVAYHRVLAGLALRQNDGDRLRSELAELERLEPGNSRMQFNLAAVDSGSTDPGRAREARAKLEEMARGDTDRIRATLQLMQLVAGRQYGASLVELARKILPLPPSDPTKLTAAFAAHMEAQPKPGPADAADLIRWLSAHGLAVEALAWAEGLPAETVGARPVELARATAAIHAKDWRALESALRGGAWGPVRPSLIDSAFIANQLRGDGEVKAMNAWDLTVDQATGSLAGLRFLDNLGIALGWPTARDRVLWRMGRDFPKETGAWQVLALGAEAKGDSAALAKVYDGWLLAEPGNPTVMASKAILATIRGEVLGESRSYLERAVAQPQPLVEEVAAWAWLETLAGRRPAALAKLDSIQEKIRVSPRACLFYGLILAEAGRRAEARLYLSKAEKQPKLLPEEKLLIDRGRRLAGSGV